MLNSFVLSVMQFGIWDELFEEIYMVKIIACIGIGAAITALCIVDPFIGIMALMGGGLIMWGISST